MEEAKRYLRTILNILIPLTGIYLVCFWGPKLLGFFIPFVIGWVIALIANPLVRFLERRMRIVRKHGSALIIVGVLALIILLLYLVIGKLYTEIRDFIGDLPALYENAALEIRGALENGGRLFEFLPDEFQETVVRFTENLGSYMGEIVSKAAAPTVEIAGNVAKGIPNALVNTVITILSAYIFIAEQERIMEWLRKILPEAIILDNCEGGRDVCMIHGHQADFFNSVCWRLSRALVRYVWKPLERSGVNDPTSAAVSYTHLTLPTKRIV